MRIALVLAVVALSACGREQAKEPTAMPHSTTPQHSPQALSLARVQPRAPGAVVEIVSDALGADGAIDLRHSSYGDNLSPPLSWIRILLSIQNSVVQTMPELLMDELMKTLSCTGLVNPILHVHADFHRANQQVLCHSRALLITIQHLPGST